MVNGLLSPNILYAQAGTTSTVPSKSRAKIIIIVLHWTCLPASSAPPIGFGTRARPDWPGLVRTNNGCLHAHAANRTNLSILRWVAQLIIDLTLGDLTGSYLRQLPPIILVKSPQTTADRSMLRRWNALANSICIMLL